MAKIAKLLKDLAKRAKVESETIKSILESEEVANLEIAEEEYNSILAGLYNLETAEAVLKPKIAATIKGETLNGVDASIFQSLESSLSETEIEAVKLMDSTKKKLDKALELIKAKQPATGTEDEDKVKSLTKAIEEAKAELRAKDSSHLEMVKELEAKHKSDVFRIGLQTRVLSRADVAKEAKEGRHFMQNFIADMDEHLNKEGVQIDYVSGEITKTDGTPYFSKTNEKISLDDLLGTVIKEYKYLKQSEPPTRGVIEVDASGNANILDLDSDLY